MALPETCIAWRFPRISKRSYALTRAVFWLVSTGSPMAAGLAATGCALVVATIDNLLRPRRVGTDARMSDLMIPVSTLGGLSLIGAVGFIVGPIVAALFVTLRDVCGGAFPDSLSPVR